jgi:tetratricopeptide (TPR) repeat protein
VAEAADAIQAAIYARGALDNRKAFSLATKAVALAPDMAEAHFTLGLIADDQCLPESQSVDNGRRCNMAYEEYQKTLLLNPNHLDALKNLAYLSHQRERKEEADRYYRKALSLSPEDPELLDAVAAMDFRSVWPDINAARYAFSSLDTQANDLRWLASSSCLPTRARDLARLNEALELLTRALKVRPYSLNLISWTSVVHRARSLLQCGVVQAYLADTNASRILNRQYYDGLGYRQDQLFQKTPTGGPPSAPPE